MPAQLTLIQFNTNLDNLSATPYIAFSINLLQKIYTHSDFLLTITKTNSFLNAALIDNYWLAAPEYIYLLIQ